MNALELRAFLLPFPPGTLLPVSAVLALLDGNAEPAAPRADLTVGSTVAQVAEQLHRAPSTIRSWLERGDFPGAFKLQGRSWLIPASALTAFLEGQRHAQRAPLSAWRGRDG